MNPTPTSLRRVIATTAAVAVVAGALAGCSASDEERQPLGALAADPVASAVAAERALAQLLFADAAADGIPVELLDALARDRASAWDAALPAELASGGGGAAGAPATARHDDTVPFVQASVTGATQLWTTLDRVLRAADAEGAARIEVTGDPRLDSTLANGRMTSTTASTTRIDGEGGATGTAEVTTGVDGAVCPDADGVVDVTMEFRSRLAIAHPELGEASGEADVELHLRARFDDRARLADLDTDAVAGVAQSMAASGKGRAGSYAELALRHRMTGLVDRDSAWLSAWPATVRRSSSGMDRASLTTLGTALGQFSQSMSLTLADSIERFVRGGACVRVELSADPGPDGLEPGERSTVHAAPVARADGQDAGGEVEASLVAGAGSVVDGGPHPAPGDVVYRAADEEGASGTVEVVATSRRGIGTARITLGTGTTGYRVDATSNGIAVTGLKCGGPWGSWQLSLVGDLGDGVHYEASLAGDVDAGTRTGEYTMSGWTSAGGHRYPFSGPGTITIVERDGGYALQLRSANDGYAGVGDYPLIPAPEECGAVS